MQRAEVNYSDEREVEIEGQLIDSLQSLRMDA